MTERTNIEGTGFVEDLGPLFGSLWNDADGRKCLRTDVMKRGPRAWSRVPHAWELLDGLEDMAEQASATARISALEAKRHAAKAREIAESYVSA